MDSQHYELVEATAGGDTMDHFVVGLKDCLKEKGYMNSTKTNSGSWDGCARRTWCNNVFRDAFPSAIKGCFKQFKCITIETYNGSTTKISNDYFALFAEKEIFGGDYHGSRAEANALTQIAYYKTGANRVKKVNGTADYWWERSPIDFSNHTFCDVTGGGGYSYYNSAGAAGLDGIAPFGCI